MSPERRAVLLLLGLALLGQGVRVALGRPGVPPGQLLLQGGGPPGAPRAHRDSSLAHARPLAAGDRIDLDRAAAAEIARLPRVGPGLARAIVADRERRGPFGGLEGLDRVSGVGPGLLAAIAPHAAFSAAGRVAPAGGGDRTAVPVGAPPAPPAPAPGQAVVLDLNAATVVELEGLPFVGPYMAGQIVAFRDRHGPFPAVDSLVRVPGVGPATVARVRARLRVGGR
ncbi:MAG: helix-hairpin-helix domain-containing protein [Gemmatimonadetes bacterium]|nr:helix-hairpin-helix domain-containing protein [Gemmatimonadota bacterium]